MDVVDPRFIAGQPRSPAHPADAKELKRAPQAPLRVPTSYEETKLERLQQEYAQLMEEKRALEMCVLKSEERCRAFMHILSDLNTVYRKLSDQRK